jgi:tetratricopeptide (TPR) repeat protein
LALAVHYAVDSEQGLQQLKQVWEQAERDPSLPPDVRLTLLLNLIDGYDNAAKTGEAAALRSVLEQFEPAPQIGTLLWYRRQSALLEDNNFDPASIEAIRAFAAEAASFRASWGWQAEELLARYLRRAERFAEAAPIHDRLIEHHRKTGVRINLAAVLRTSVFKAPATPEKLARLGEALEIMVSELGAGHPETLLTRMNLVEARLQSGELEGVDAEFVELIDQQRHFQSEVSVATMANYVRYLIDRRDFKRAAPFAVEALALAPKLNLNPDAPMSLAPRLYAAQVDLGRGDVAAVNAVLPGLLNDAKNAPAAYWRMLLLSADTRHRMGDHKQALVVAEQAKAAFPARPANAPPSAHLGRIHALLGEIHVALGELELAKANLEQALAIDQQAPEAWCVWPARAQLVLAKLLAQDPSHLQRAAQLRAAGETRMAKLTQPDDPWRTDLRSP